ncbi:hypothetical protein KDK_47430 [Dictyobacter kobayashii]|uniref:Uncharacterized protein n=1 Tax=Dictyobacter kobayashii TaxID=2014872 RepID=A0A402AP51_9CHLR|nr:hypothetical protein KDK_47430 [Dictyobacter kobayashii]
MLLSRLLQILPAQATASIDSSQFAAYAGIHNGISLSNKVNPNSAISKQEDVP